MWPSYFWIDHISHKVHLTVWGRLERPIGYRVSPSRITFRLLSSFFFQQFYSTTSISKWGFSIQTFHPSLSIRPVSFLLDAGVSRGAIGDRTGHVHQSSSSSIGGSRCFPLRGRSIRRLIDRGAPLGYIWGRVSRYFFCFVLFCFVLFFFGFVATPQSLGRPPKGQRPAGERPKLLANWNRCFISRRL